MTAAGAAGAVGRARRRVPSGALESKVSVQGVPREQEPGLAPGRPRALQPRREPQGRRGAVRVPRDLHDAAVGAARRRSTCRSARRCASTRAPRTRRGCCRCCCRCSARPSSARGCKAMVDAGEIYPSAALDAARRRFSCSTDVPALEAAGVVVRVPGDVARRTVRRVRRCSATVGAQAAVRARRRTRCSTSGWRSRSTASR